MPTRRRVKYFWLIGKGNNWQIIIWMIGERVQNTNLVSAHKCWDTNNPLIDPEGRAANVLDTPGDP